MEATGSPVLPRLQEGGKQEIVEGLTGPPAPLLSPPARGPQAHRPSARVSEVPLATSVSPRAPSS